MRSPGLENRGPCAILVRHMNSMGGYAVKTAFFNARVYTGEFPLRSAFLTEDGRFAAVGGDEEILAALGDGDARVDLGGRFVCPGFNDSHMHLLGFGSTLGQAQFARARSLREMLDIVRAFLAEHPPRDGQWLLGRGWNQDLFADGHRMPDRHDLDAVSADVPILLMRACGHCCAVNSKALALAGIGPDTPAPGGGAIGMADGLPDGRLYDNAITLAQRVLPAPGKAELRDMLRAACRAVNRCGITSVQTDDYQVFPGVSWETVNEVYREMADAGELTVRVCEQAQLTDPASLEDFVRSGHGTGTGTDMFRIGPVKLLGDGSLGSRTALLSVPYADDPSTRGIALYPDGLLGRMIGLAHALGMQVAVHAIGDACLDQVLDAVEAALRDSPRPDHRHGIVHCQITRPDQLRRIADLGMHVYAQSVFLDYDSHIVEARVGKALAASSYSWKTLTDSGVTVSNGSDCPVELPDVMAGIECAVTRTAMDGTGPYLPGQAFTVREALDSFTLRGARASFEEAVKGRIAPGFLADFTVLSADPFEAEPRRLHEIRAEACYLGGRCVYDARADR